MLPAVLLLLFSVFSNGVQCFDSQEGTMRIPIYRGEKQIRRGSLKSLMRKINNTNDEDKIDVILRNFWNIAYFGEMTIGTPPQKFLADFDTHFSNTLVASEKCTEEVCREHKRYNASASSTSEGNGTEVVIENGQVGGLLAKDTLCIGTKCVKGQYFVEGTRMEQSFIKDAPFDGIVSLGPFNTTSLGVPSVFHSLIEQKQISNPVFAFWLNRNNESGELTFGGIDETRFEGDITWTPRRGKQDWAVILDNVEFQSKNISCPDGCYAVEVAPSSPGLFGPINTTDVIHKLLGFESLPAPYVKVYFSRNCSEEQLAAFPEISFVIEGKKFSVGAKDYVWYYQGFCYSMFAGIEIPEMDDLWVLGEAFVGRYYSIFDFGQQRMGFAKAKAAKKTTGHSKKARKQMKKMWHRMQKFARGAHFPF